MRLVRVLAASLAILGMSTASFAGDLLQSAAKAVQQEAQAGSLSDRWDAGYRRACDNIVNILGALDAGEQR